MYGVVFKAHVDQQPSSMTGGIHATTTCNNDQHVSTTRVVPSTTTNVPTRTSVSGQYCTAPSDGPMTVNDDDDLQQGTTASLVTSNTTGVRTRTTTYICNE